MSKLISGILILVILFFSYIPSFFSTAYAVDSCKDSFIDYDPKLFQENIGDLNFVFTIQNPNTANVLNGNPVWLHFSSKPLHAGDYDTQPTAVSGNSFALIIKKSDLNFTNKALVEPGDFNGELYWKDPSNGKGSVFCSQVTYRVGTAGGCTIDSSTPTEIPPGTPIPNIAFVGVANQEYKIQIENSPRGDLASTTTDSSGQGLFKNLVIPGNNGDKLRLVIYKLAPVSRCTWDIAIKASAAQPVPPPPGPVAPVPLATPTSAPWKNLAKAGGSPAPECNVLDNGIGTAIGCIHTSPAGFVKDFMTFIVGISGGFAFLMMVLGAFQMLTSAGNPETLTAGRERLTSAIIGLLFIIFSVLLLQIIGVKLLGLF